MIGTEMIFSALESSNELTDSQTGESPGTPFGVPIDFLTACPLPGLSLSVGRETGLLHANGIDGGR